jgi:hypothetical protein
MVASLGEALGAVLGAVLGAADGLGAVLGATDALGDAALEHAATATASIGARRMVDRLMTGRFLSGMRSVWLARVRAGHSI